MVIDGRFTRASHTALLGLLGSGRFLKKRGTSHQARDFAASVSMVLCRVAKLEEMLTDVHAVQLVEVWPPGRVADEQRTKLLQETQKRVQRVSDANGLKMVRYIYGASDESGARPDRRRRRSGWEI